MTRTQAMRKTTELTRVGGALDLGPDAARLLARAHVAAFLRYEP